MVQSYCRPGNRAVEFFEVSFHTHAFATLSPAMVLLEKK